jgi:MFS family permease
MVTLAVYGAISVVFFLLVVQLQQVLQYPPILSGVGTLPVTILMLLLSPTAGRVAQRIGARIPLTVGPLVIALGTALMARIDAGSSYVADVLPAVVVFGLGLAFTVAPLTATVMSAVEERHAGLASAVNNAVARAAGLIAVAVVPPLAGLTGQAYLDPLQFSAGFHTAVFICAGLTALGGLFGWILLAERPPLQPKERHEFCCAVGAPPLRSSPAASYSQA